MKIPAATTTTTTTTTDPTTNAADATDTSKTTTARPLRTRYVSIQSGEKTGTAVGVEVFEALDPGAAIDEAIRTGAPAPYGAVLWDSAVDVARQLWREDLRGRRVLELGCGCGLAGIVAAKRGARVRCTDVDPLVLSAVTMAAAKAEVAVDVDVFDLMGAEPLPTIDGDVADDLILADVLYEPTLAAACARRALEGLKAGMRVIVGDPERAGRTAFIKLLAEHEVVVDFKAVVDAGALTPPRAPAPTVAILASTSRPAPPAWS